MTKYIVRRLVGAIPLVIGIATIVFFAVNLAPGDPTARFLAPGMSQAVIDQMRTNFGLDEPLPVRYVKWLGAKTGKPYRLLSEPERILLRRLSVFAGRCAT